jgi:hypothetical protein
MGGWSLIAGSGTGPLGREGVASVYDAVRDRIIVFGGIGNGIGFEDVWSLGLGETAVWSELHPLDGAPAAREGSGGIYDPIRESMVFFGGSILNDTWALAWSDVSTAVTGSLISAEVLWDHVHLEWRTQGGITQSGTIYKRTVATPWEGIGEVVSDGIGGYTYDDYDISRGARVAYRLGLSEGEQEEYVGETWVEIPAARALSLRGLWPNPTRGDVNVVFSLGDMRPALLEAFDLAGKRVLERELRNFGSGDHSIVCTGDGLPPGMYLLRLSQGERSVIAKGVVLR